MSNFKKEAGPLDFFKNFIAPDVKPDDINLSSTDLPQQQIETKEPAPVVQEKQPAQPKEKLPPQIKTPPYTAIPPEEQQEQLKSPVEPKNVDVYTYTTPPEYASLISGESARGADINYDNSIACLIYLASFGYDDCMWEVGEHHDKWDECDLQDSVTRKLADIIEDAVIHKTVEGYNGPPAALWQYSHPDCRCHYLCYKPVNDYNDIPDTAPGLPIYATPEDLREYKFKLWKRLPLGFIVDAYSLPPDINYRATAALKIISERNKYAEAMEWTKYIKPVRINRDGIVDIGLGMKHFINKDDLGFIIKIAGNDCLVYSNSYKRTFILEQNYIDELRLSESTEKIVDVNTFISTNDGLGIIYRIMEDNIFAYFPELDTITKVEEYTVLSLLT